jgi:hypothetical protein
VEKFEGPIDAHFERLGIEMPVDLVPRVREISDPSEVELTEEAALAEVAHYLISAERKDPALATGPLATVIRDVSSLAIYFFIALQIL